MLEFKPYKGPTKLIVAFDIGTTYSSISYFILEPHQIPKVRTVARYPGQGAACADTKLPSLLYYDQSGTVRAAGAEALAQDVIKTALTEGWQKAEWWKLHLRPGHLNSDSVEDLPSLPLGKAAVDILTDFIKYLFDCCKTYIQGRHPKFSWSSVQDSIEYILTYPGGWDEQQYVYRHAVQQAGLVPSTASGQNRIYMLTEGEASLHSCLSHLFKGETAGKAAPEGVVVIDAGGGIIGLSTFSLTMTYDPISCKGITKPESRLQGSLFVSCRAKALMERKLESWEHSGTENIARFTREFDQTTKLVIDSDRIPAYVRVADRRTESTRHGISSGQLQLSGQEATGLFNDSVDTIITAFEKHQESTTMPITTALVVGGLARNDWVWSQLQSYFSARQIAIPRPTNHGKVVAQGALLHAASTRLVDTPSACPYTGPFTNLLSRKCSTHDAESRVQRIMFRECLGGLFARVCALLREYNPRAWVLRAERYAPDASMSMKAAYREWHRGLVPDKLVLEK